MAANNITLTGKALYDRMSNKDIVCYFNWLQKKTASNEEVKYDLSANLNPFGSYDVIQTKLTVTGDFSLSYLELKGRYYFINQFADCAVEADKIKRLCQISNATGCKCYVVAIYFNSGKLAIWELDPSEEYKVEIMRCNKTTAVNPEDREKVNKEMVKLPLAQAKIYTL